MEELIQLDSYPVQTTLRVLLQDKTTKKNIIWATDFYASFGETYTDRSQITENQLKKMNYEIATNYILGFGENVVIAKHNFRQVDTLECAKNGTLEEMLDEIYKE